MNEKITQGDVFTMPLSDELLGLGQIVYVLQNELYVIAFDDTWRIGKPPIADDVVGRTPVFSSLTLDALFYHDVWKIIGNTHENIKDIKLPLYKMRTPDGVYIESIDCNLLRLAKNDELNYLLSRTTVSPICIQNAVQAINGLIEWDKSYEELEYIHTERASSIEL